MTALYIVLAAAAVLALFCLVPVGAELRFDDGGPAFAARVWFLSFRLGGEGRTKKPDRRVGTRKEPAREKAEKPKAPLPPLPVLRILAKNGFRTLGRLVSAIRVDALRIRFTAAFEDPADTAMVYGAAAAAMETLLRLGEGRIGHPDLRADADFDASEPRLDLLLRLTVRVGRLIGAALGFGFGFLREYIPYKKQERMTDHGR